VQINGKLKAEINVDVSIQADELAALALALPKVAELLAGKTPKKVIAIPAKIVNIVV
jgi:leucyl-tRNA synthetase